MTHDVYTVPIRTEPAYDVLVGHGLLAECGKRIRAIASDCRVMIVSDDTVYALYGEKVTRSLEDAGLRQTLMCSRTVRRPSRRTD